MIAFSRLNESTIQIVGYAEGIRRALGQDHVDVSALLLAMFDGDPVVKGRFELASVTRERLFELLVTASKPPFPLTLQYEPVRIDLNYNSDSVSQLPRFSKHSERAFDLAQESTNDTVDGLILLRAVLSVRECSVIKAFHERIRIPGWGVPLSDLARLADQLAARNLYVVPQRTEKSETHEESESSKEEADESPKRVSFRGGQRKAK